VTLPWYRRFPDNFIAGTVGLSLEEKGAYSLILDLMYVRGGPVPDEPRYIAGVCNCSVRKWNAIRQRLIDLGKITVAEGYLTNHRAEEEIEIGRKISREAAENGSKGGDKSAEIRATAKKNNALGQASLKLSTSTANKKEGATRSDPTVRATTRLNRSSDEGAALWAECERIMEKKAPTSTWDWAFPADIVARARTNLDQARAQAVH
jgi:uncharacterized protein YdaU (DUF1376 family)